MRILLAFDKFKDALSADEACRLVREALGTGTDTYLERPLTDGGEGFARIMTRVLGGEVRTDAFTGPRGEPIGCEWGLVARSQERADLWTWLDLGPEGKLAVVEMAQASGLQSLAPEDRDLWQTTTRGTGETLAAAADVGADAILLGIGGSATNDLGLGALQALGVTARDRDDQPLDPPVPATWDRLDHFRGAVPDGFPVLRVACDVRNPLLGDEGAAAIYGPQKGLREADRSRLEALMKSTAETLCDHLDVSRDLMEEPSSGAAGGIGFGLRAAFGARYVPGFDLVARSLALEEAVRQADLVITGEGRFDASSLHGKGPGTLLDFARRFSKPAVVFAGAITADARTEVSGQTDAPQLIAITPEGVDLPEALRRADEFLQQAVRTWWQQHS